MVVLELTAEGREAVSAMKLRAPDVTARTLADLSPDEARTLVDLLRRLG